MLCFGISKLMFNNFWLLMMHGRKLQTLGTCALQNLGSLRKFEVEPNQDDRLRWNPTRMIISNNQIW
nr:hypothetical protein CFP56_68586 [Quercus suber]